MLTRKQKELLLLIRERLDFDGVPPSFDEMKDALGLRSKSGIHRLITGLEERGFIKRLPHRARALEITRMPEGIEPKIAKPALRKLRALAESGSAPPLRAAGNLGMPSLPAIAAGIISLPLYGKIAAGTPIEALRDTSVYVDIPAGMLAARRGLKAPAEHYALEVSGDSMIEAGIFDGDNVIIRKCDTADNGAIVVALIDEAEATLKYFERRSGQIALIPANKDYETRLLSADRVQVQGQLAGLVRKY